jgi:cysteine desulfurase family protein
MIATVGGASLLSIYLDNAATSWPKCPQVIAAMQEYLCECGGSPGRAGHGKSLTSSRMVYDTRDQLTTLFNATSTDRIAFAKNATEALNMILFGFLNPGDHVLTSGMEHNAVMRPLRQLESCGVKLSSAACDGQGRLDPDSVRRLLTSKTRLILTNHASNVTGTIQPIAEIGALAREAGVRFAVDAAQTAGICPLDMQAASIDFLAFTGHKSLGGPQGTGGLALGPDVDLRPQIFGGTGSASESEIQPDFLPDKLESGTLNAIGLAGLGAALEDLTAFGIDKVLSHEQKLLRRFRDGLRELTQIEVYGPADPVESVGVLSLNVTGIPCDEVGRRLEQQFGILTRTGLHCAPAAHRSIGTLDKGTVRFSVSRFTTESDIEAALAALASIANDNK